MDTMNETIIAPDFLALGLGGTNMMSVLWTVAMGRRAVGVEMRGDPFLGVHWNIREDFYHQLGLIDQMMLERYGEERLPRLYAGLAQRRLRFERTAALDPAEQRTHEPLLLIHQLRPLRA